MWQGCGTFLAPVQSSWGSQVLSRSAPAPKAGGGLVPAQRAAAPARPSRVGMNGPRYVWPVGSGEVLVFCVITGAASGLHLSRRSEAAGGTQRGGERERRWGMLRAPGRPTANQRPARQPPDEERVRKRLPVGKTFCFADLVNQLNSACHEHVLQYTRQCPDFCSAKAY